MATGIFKTAAQTNADIVAAITTAAADATTKANNAQIAATLAAASQPKSADTIVDGIAAKSFTAAEKMKLAGLSSGGGSFDAAADQTITGEWDFTTGVSVLPIVTNAVALTLSEAPDADGSGGALNIIDGQGALTGDGSPVVVTRLSADGSGSFANGHIHWNAAGNVAIEVDDGAPLSLNKAGGAAGAVAFFGGGSTVGVAASGPGDNALQVAPHDDTATADTIASYDPNGFNALFRVRPDGAVVTAGAEPADADLAPGQVAWWYDPTEGAPRIRFKGKDSAGTVFDLSP